MAGVLVVPGAARGRAYPPAHSGGDGMTETPTKAAFLGREAELGLLLGGLDETEAGRGGLVLVGGEPGIGKSRLADEVSSQARDRGFVALWGRGWEDAGAPPYWPWVQVLRSYVRQTDADTVRRQLGPGAVDIAQMLPEIHELVPDLEAPSAGESDAARFQLFDSTATFLRAAGLTRPLLVVLDDLQAADPSSLRLLGFLASQLGDMRVLIIGTYRDVELSPDHPLTIAMADLVRAPIARTISLSGLGRDALRSLIGATTGTAPDEHLVAAMARGTKGNPLFAHEALRLLSAEGRLDELASGPSRIVAVPPGVRAVIARRLERLAAPTRSMLTIGAVVGPEFDAELIGAIGDSDGTPLEDALDEAVREGLLGEAGGVQGRYRFSHDLIRETLYDELSPGSRRRLHRRVADALEDEQRDAPESHLAELAYHFFESERDPVADREGGRVRAPGRGRGIPIARVRGGGPPVSDRPRRAGALGQPRPEGSTRDPPGSRRRAEPGRRSPGRTRRPDRGVRAREGTGRRARARTGRAQPRRAAAVVATRSRVEAHPAAPGCARPPGWDR